MAFSPYVHRYSNHARLLKGYGSKTNTDILSSDVFSVFKNPSLTDIQKSMKNISGQKDFKNARKFFKELAADLTQSFENDNNYANIEKGLKYKSSNITSSTGFSLKQKSTDLKNNINKLSMVVNLINKYEDTIDKFVSSKGGRSTFVNMALSSFEGSDFLQNYDTIRDYRKMFSKNVIVKTSNIRNQDARLGNLLGMKSVLKKILKTLETNGQKNLSDKEAGIIEHAINSSLFYMGLISGDVQEYVTKLKTENISKEIFKKYFPNSDTIKIVQEGTSRVQNTMSSVSKGDVSILISNNGDMASAQIKLPISVKGTGQKIGGSGAISIHSSSTIEKIFLSVTKKSSQDKAFQGLLNMILWGDTRRESSFGNFSYTKSERNEAYRIMRNSAVINALAGSLGNDFSYFIVINNKVFSMYELLEKVISNKNSNFMSSAISTQEKQPSLSSLKSISPEDWNSRSVAQAIASAHFDIKLKMNIFNGMV